MEVVDIVFDSEWEFWETYWIHQFKTWNFDLKNGDDGGKGISSEFMKANNPMFKQEHRDKVSLSLMGNTRRRGKKNSQETIDKIKANAACPWLGKARPEISNWLVAAIRKSVEVLNVATGTIQLFESQKECAQSLGMTEGTVTRAIRRGYITKSGYILKNTP